MHWPLPIQILVLLFCVILGSRVFVFHRPNASSTPLICPTWCFARHVLWCTAGSEITLDYQFRTCRDLSMEDDILAQIFNTHFIKHEKDFKLTKISIRGFKKVSKFTSSVGTETTLDNQFSTCRDLNGRWNTCKYSIPISWNMKKIPNLQIFQYGVSKKIPNLQVQLVTERTLGYEVGSKRDLWMENEMLTNTQNPSHKTLKRFKLYKSR